MSSSEASYESQLAEAIEQRDPLAIRQLIEQGEFVLLTAKSDEEDTSEAESDEDIDNVFCVNVDDMDLMVTFSNDEAVKDFVMEMQDMYEDSEDIEGYVLEGASLLAYTPPEMGILINPESDCDLAIDAELFAQVQSSEA